MILKILKRILLIAITLEALKFLIMFLIFNYLPEKTNEFLKGMLAITMFIMMLPEMMVSYEKGPHGTIARIVMFSAGTIVNVVLIGIAVSIWQGTKRKKQKTRVKANGDV